MHEKDLLRLAATGSVDDGKSTLMGRLLYEAGAVFDDQYEAVDRASRKRGLDKADLSLLFDGLAAEREQGITIDVAYRSFETVRRRYLIADCPGHEQYTRNMISGVSNADCALVLVDACIGLTEQSKRHAFIVSLMQTPHLVVVVNKMDLVGYSRELFVGLVDEYRSFSAKLDLRDVVFLPVSALLGDNVRERSASMPWYQGPPLLAYLEDLQIFGSRNLIDFRFPVQQVTRTHQGFRGLAGRIASGTVTVGEEVVTLPSGRASRVTSIWAPGGEVSEAFCPQSVTITLADDLDIGRGDMVARVNNLPQAGESLGAMLCWMGERPLDVGVSYLLRHTTRTVRAVVKRLIYRLDVVSLHRIPGESLKENDIGRVEVQTTDPLFFDPYRANRATGSFVLIDTHSNATVAAGMILGAARRVQDVAEQPQSTHKPGYASELPKVGQQEPERMQRHAPAVVWFTGLSGAGKSTIARAVEQNLLCRGRRVVLLDGDDLRAGLCSDLGFSNRDRSENIRRAGEVARLFFANGAVTLCSFISPFAKDRAFVRSLIPPGKFMEVFVNCSAQTCRQRDPKGLYRKADAGAVPAFTGVSSPYEEPSAPDLVLDSERLSVDECTAKVLDLLQRRFLSD